MEVMSSKVELVLEPPKLSQEDIDTEVRKNSNPTAYGEINLKCVHQDEEDEQNEMHSRVALSGMVYPIAVAFASISLAGKVTIINLVR